MRVFAQLAILCTLLHLLTAPAGAGPPDARRRHLQVTAARSLIFEPNARRTEPEVKFIAALRGLTVSFLPHEIRFSAPRQTRSAAIRMTFAGASSSARLEASDPLPGKSHYFSGSDPAGWRTDVPGFARLWYRGLYPGVDVVFYGSRRGLEYDLILAPGVDPAGIRILFPNAAVGLDADGGLVVRTPAVSLKQRPTAAYQEPAGGRVPVHSSYVLSPRGEVTFSVAGYDRTHPLVLDPELTYSSYLGGANNDEGTSVAADAAGNVYVAGRTASANFPTTGSAFTTELPSSLGAVFVTKFDGVTGVPIYSTYIAGHVSAITAVTVDFDGSAILAFNYASSRLPLVNPISRKGNLSLVKLDPSGSKIVYSTFLGGSSPEHAYAITVDKTGAVYVAGDTVSTDFLLKNPIIDRMRGDSNAFVLKVSADGTELVYSTYLGGSEKAFARGDSARGIAVDSEGCAYVTGSTGSADFPTVNPLQPLLRGRINGFVTKLNAEGTKLVYSTFLGGSRDDWGMGIAVDADGEATISGEATSPDFPGGNAAQRIGEGGLLDMFIARLDSSGGRLIYSTVVGGARDDWAEGVALDASGFAWVAGTTTSPSFPMTAGAGTSRAQVATLRVSPRGVVDAAIVFGGRDWEQARAVAADNRGGIWLTGQTQSEDFPTVRAFQPGYGGAGRDGNTTGDAFVARVTEPPAAGAGEPGIHNGGIVIHGGAAAVASPGSIVDLYGANLSATELAPPAGKVLPRILGGLQVVVNGIAAPLLWVGPAQVVFQIPYETALGTATVELVARNFVRKAPLTVQAAAPCILTYEGDRAVVVNPDGGVNASGNGAAPGNVVVAYVTGSGPLDNPIPTGAPAPVSPLSRQRLPTVASLDGIDAVVQFAGMTPGFVGLVQVNLVVPNVSPGNHFLQVIIGGAESNRAVITVSR